MEKILVVENRAISGQPVVQLLEREGYEPVLVQSAAESARFSEAGGFDLVITALPESFPHTIENFSKSAPGVPIIALATSDYVEAAIAALRKGVARYLVVPFIDDDLKLAVASCLEQKRLLSQVHQLKRQVSLYRNSLDLARCLDIDCIGSTIVAAFADELGVERGLALLMDEEGYLSLKGLKGLDDEAGKALGALIMAAFEKREEKHQKALFLDGFVPRKAEYDFARRQGLTDAVALGVYNEDVLQGVVALFSDAGKSLCRDWDMDGLDVLLDQAAGAFQNASKYSTAKNLLNIDELTGLFNYRYLETALDREIKRAERYRSSLSVLFLDLDQFKDVNDSYGHLVGSKVLKEVGGLIKRHVREVDTVIRYGGDEYTIILVESTSVGAASVAERIRRAVEGHTFMAHEGYSIRLSASLGYACYPDDSKSHTELLEMADQAMYRGKFSGKNVVFHIGQDQDRRQGE